MSRRLLAVLITGAIAAAGSLGLVGLATAHRTTCRF